MNKKIDIGFVEECESWKLQSRFFPSKVGGKPAWLNLKHLPTVRDIECQVCKNPCIFLCQIYAPYEEDPRAFHRTLYVFVCKSGMCCRVNNSDNLRILRCQLPRENQFYPIDPPVEHENWRPDIGADKWVKTCRVCGILAQSHCGKCKNVSYCCRAHQIVDWKSGHKQQCNAELPKDNAVATLVDANGILFPEYELVIETEVENHKKNEVNGLEKEKEEMKHFESLVKSGEAGTLQSLKDIDTDLQKMSHSEHDETFTKFSEKMKNHPDQVLSVYSQLKQGDFRPMLWTTISGCVNCECFKSADSNNCVSSQGQKHACFCEPTCFCFLYDRGGRPLHISSNGRAINVGKCEECNSERQFEFQIMPQLLNYLNFHDVLRSVDWGTLLIFTCQNSCVPKAGYIAEYIFKQDICQVSQNVEANKDEP